MDINIHYRPVNSLAQVRLETDEEIVVEPSAMVGMSINVYVGTGLAGSHHDDDQGMLSKVTGAASRMLTQESFYQSTFRARESAGEVLLSHKLTGDMQTVELPATGLIVQSGSYIASHPDIRLNTQLGGFKSVFAGEGLFLIEATSPTPGVPILLGAFGGIEERTIDGSLVIDTGHLVAWDAGLDYSVERAASGWIDSMLSGEGLVCHFEGEGRVWLQTRNQEEFGQAIGPRLPARQG